MVRMNPVQIAVCFALAAVIVLSCRLPGPDSPGATRAATVTIISQCLGQGTWTGSGAAVGPSHVVTAFHVVEQCPTQAAVVLTDDGRMMLGIVDRAHVSGDIALLKVTGRFDSWLELGGAPERGEWACMTAAAPTPRRACGRVAEHDETWWRLLFRSEPGNSGSPVTDASGRLIGIVFGSYRDGGGTAVSNVPWWILP
jgi:S1-C subfamily serine protease